MPVITFTSDFGLNDHYLAVIKGAMLCANEQLCIVDISHNIRPYDIVQGAFTLKQAYPSFPKGSIHILSVNNFYASQSSFLAIRYGEHYFIGPDNGIFALLFDEAVLTSNEAFLVVELTIASQDLAGLQELYADTANQLVNGRPINEIGTPVESIREVIAIHPVIMPHRIQGVVLHIDHYGNAITNITKAIFEKAAQERKFRLFYKNSDPILKLSRHYHDAPIGEVMCLFNAAGHLEIAINSGQAASMLDLKRDDTVQIDFL